MQNRVLVTFLVCFGVEGAGVGTKKLRAATKSNTFCFYVGASLYPAILFSFKDVLCHSNIFCFYVGGKPPYPMLLSLKEDICATLMQYNIKVIKKYMQLYGTVMNYGECVCVGGGGVELRAATR